MARVQWLVAVSVGILVLGCSSSNKPPNPPPGTVDPSGKDGGTDPTTNPDIGTLPQADAGVIVCKLDDDCAPLGASLRCNEVTGECIPGTRCNDSTNCVSTDPDDYCSEFGIGCRCVAEAASDGLAGVCRRRRSVCEPCTDNSQCGDGPTFNPQGTCMAIPGDTSGTKFCFNKAVGSSCPNGMKRDATTNYCVPQSGSCSVLGCASDTDCRAGEVCDTDRKLCEPRCYWNYVTHTVTNPGCPSGKTCWVDHANLNASSPYFGAGRCRAPCTSEAECTDTTLNPNGGSTLTCREDPVGGLKRCRAKGQCMDDQECPSLDPGSPNLGYCDKQDFTCKTDCRTGTDQVTTRPYDDCKVGFKCVSSGGSNVCVERPCYELGGARIACGINQLCSGEDRNGDGIKDFAPAGTTTTSNGCYTAPSPPFCMPCESQADCAPLSNISGSPFTSACYKLTKEDKTSVNNCLIPTRNAPLPDGLVSMASYRGCPTGYSVFEHRIDLNPGDVNHNCATDADCGPGGVCGNDPTQRLADGTAVKSCLCKPAGGTPSCPTKSVCRASNAAVDVCLDTVFCLPGNAVLTLPVESGGCGF